MKAFFNNVFHLSVPQSKNRIISLDIIRGIIMLLVIFQHAGFAVGDYVLQFHMPALFLLSGYTEYRIGKKTSFGSYCRAKFRRLIIPYFVFEIVSLILFFGVQIVRKESLSVPLALLSILTCVNNAYVGLFGRLWFLPAIFVSSIFVYLIKNFLCARHRWMSYVSLPVLLALAYVTSEFLPFRLPFAVDIAFMGTFFVLLGHICGPVLDKLLSSKKWMVDICILLVTAAIFVACNIIGDPQCYMCTNEYYAFPLVMIVSVSASLGLFVVCKLLAKPMEKIKFLQKAILWFSYHSLAVFPVHLLIKTLSIPVLTALGIYSHSLIFVEMLLLSIPVVNLITRYFPFALGVFPKR